MSKVVFFSYRAFAYLWVVLFVCYEGFDSFDSFGGSGEGA